MRTRWCGAVVDEPQAGCWMRRKKFKKGVTSYVADWGEVSELFRDRDRFDRPGGEQGVYDDYAGVVPGQVEAVLLLAEGLYVCLSDGDCCVRQAERGVSGPGLPDSGREHGQRVHPCGVADAPRGPEGFAVPDVVGHQARPVRRTGDSG